MASQYIEQFVPVVKYNGGILTALPAVFEGGITTTGPIAGSVAGNAYPIVAPNGTVVAYTGDATLVAADLNKIATNTGASGTITLTLPAVSGLAGYLLHVELTVAQIVRVDPAGTEAIFLGGSGVAGKYLNIAAVIGNMVDIYCDGTRWLVVNRDGVITKEA